MPENSSFGNWEVSSEPGAFGLLGVSGKAVGRKPGMNADETSDGCIVPRNGPNDGGGSKPTLEDWEERRAAKRNVIHPPAPRTQSRTPASSGLDGIREAARKGRDVRFTALMHHISPGMLAESFRHQKRSAAVGVDGVTWRDYEVGLEGRVEALWASVQSGRYRAQPSRRVYIPKANGSQRPLGIAALI